MTAKPNIEVVPLREAAALLGISTRAAESALRHAGIRSGYPRAAVEWLRDNRPGKGARIDRRRPVTTYGTLRIHRSRDEIRPATIDDWCQQIILRDRVDRYAEQYDADPDAIPQPPLAIRDDILVDEHGEEAELYLMQADGRLAWLDRGEGDDRPEPAWMRYDERDHTATLYQRGVRWLEPQPAATVGVADAYARGLGCQPLSEWIRDGEVQVLPLAAPSAADVFARIDEVLDRDEPINQARWGA